jgi:hypothetical protein
MKIRPWSLFMLAMVAILLFQASCNLISKTIATGGEQRLAKVAPPPSKIGPHVIIFALDGAVPSKLMDAVDSGQAPHIAAILGKGKGNGLFAHAYAAPHALSVPPSSTIADWASVFTGAPPAYDGVTGDEWFDRATMTFVAPVPVSTPDTADNTKTVSDDLVGKAIKVPTLYEDLGVRSYVALQQVHRGATLYTTVSPGSFTDLISHLIKGELRGEDPESPQCGHRPGFRQETHRARPKWSRCREINRHPGVPSSYSAFRGALGLSSEVLAPVAWLLVNFDWSQMRKVNQFSIRSFASRV